MGQTCEAERWLDSSGAPQIGSLDCTLVSVSASQTSVNPELLLNLFAVQFPYLLIRGNFQSYAQSLGLKQ